MDFDLSNEEVAYRERVKSTIDERIRPRYPGWKERNTTPREMFEILGGAGLLGFYRDGSNFRNVPWLQSIHLYRELAELSGGCGIAAFVQANLGNEAFFLFGNESQKKEYLAPGIEGKRLFAFANTEPTAGSDASMIKASAEDRGDHYLVNGTKTFITNADFADDIIFTAVTDPKAEKPHKGITMMIVPGDAPGVTRTRLRKHGWKESHLCTVQFKDVRVPKENVLGTVGRGFYQTMELFNNGRIGVASLAFGAALGAYRRAYDHAGKRRAFGQTLISHQSKRNEFADNMAKLQAGWLLIQKAAFTADSGRDFKQYSSLAKLFVTEEGLRISLWGVITLGARGVISDNAISDYPADSVVALIGEGAPEVQKKIVGENISTLLDSL